MNHKTFQTGLLLSVCSILSVSGCASGLGRGVKAPDFTLKNMTGQDFTLSEYRGKVVLLNFWAYGREYCRVEAPHLKALQRKYGPQGFRIVAVNAFDEPLKTVRKFVEDNELPYTIVMKGGELFSGPYRGKGIPHDYLLNRKGKIIYTHLGWDDDALGKLDKEIQQVLE